MKTEEKINSPFVLSPTRIYNYTQLKATLKSIQSKYNEKIVSTKFIEEVIPIKMLEEKIKSLQNALQFKTQDFCVDEIIDGFQQNVLKKKVKNYEKECTSIFKEELKLWIQNVKVETENKLCFNRKFRINDIYVFENIFDEEFDPSYFNNPLLKDLYWFLNRSSKFEVECSEIKFLENQYFEFIERFLKENAMKVNEDLKTKEQKIRAYVTLRYNRDEYNIEVYDGVYVFAEIYTFLRCGMIEAAKKLMEKYSTFFDHLSYGFRESFTEWLENRNLNSAIKSKGIYERMKANSDTFKLFLYKLMSGHEKGVTDGTVINTLEDYIWYQAISVDEDYKPESIIKKFEDFKNPCGHFLAAIIFKFYSKAMEILFKEDFNVFECYFLMKELAKKIRKDDGEKNNINNINLFVEVVFNICKNFNSTERKTKIIQNLKEFMNEKDYVSKVSEMIVKTECYDVVGIKNAQISMLDENVCKNVGKILERKNDSEKLLQLYFLFDDEEMILKVLNKTLSEYILEDNEIKRIEDIKFMNVIEFYENRISKECEIMKILRDFLYFKIAGDEIRLRKTALFDQEKFELLRKLKIVVERIVILAASVIKKIGDRNLAMELFRLSGILLLSDECCMRVNEELMFLL